MLTITQFIDSEEHCLLKQNKVQLFPAQRCILKYFYGEPLTESEKEILFGRCNLQDLYKKAEPKEYFELVAILGRRSGKDLLSAIIAAYETYRLLSFGDLRNYFDKFASGTHHILMVDTSVEQSNVLFEVLQSTFLKAKFFKENIVENNKNNVWFKSNRMEDKDICLEVLHANSDKLMSHRYFAIIFNESAHYRTDRIYPALCPSTFVYKKDGKLLSKIVTITSPRNNTDWVYKLFTTPSPNRFAIQLPTWRINSHLDEKVLKNENSYMKDEEFRIEFGAEFLSDPYENSTISLRLTNNTIEKLKKIARKIAYEEDKEVSYVELVRDAVDEYIKKVEVKNV